MAHPNQPSWAKAAIIARLEQNTSDPQSDYFGSRTERTVIIGWSAHTKDLFSEMRKASALFPETAHLGPGCDIYTPRVVLLDDVISNGSGYWKGSQSHWHHELHGNAWDRQTFSTLAEAEAFIASKGEPEPISFQTDTPEGSKVVTFAWNIQKESIEHREKYSMGHGYYLGHSRYSGWQVSKTSMDYGVSDAELAPHLLETPKPPSPTAPAPTVQSGITMSLNADRNGVELRFPSKPSEAVRDSLKDNGWRWSRFSSCWYSRDTAAARAFAQALSGQQDGDTARTEERGLVQRPGVSHIVIGGRDYFRNRRGRCEDAPCCGCCTI